MKPQEGKDDMIKSALQQTESPFMLQRIQEPHRPPSWKGVGIAALQELSMRK